MGLLNDSLGIFFRRQLESIKARSYDVRYADLVYRELIPVTFETPAGATTITYETFDQVGVAKIIQNYAGDLPRADVSGKETTIPVRTIGDAFGYTVQEVASASMAGGVPLQQRKANAARRAIEEKMNDIAFNGDPAHGLNGFFTHPNIPVINATGLWSGLTGAQILDDLNGMATTMVETTLMVEKPNLLLLPVAQYNLIHTSFRVDNTDMSIAKQFIENSPYFTSLDQIRPINQMANVAALGDDDVALMYNRSPDKLEFEIPQDVTFYPEQDRNLETVIPVASRCAGVNVYYPLSLLILRGI